MITSRSDIVTLVLRDLILVSNPMFRGKGNHLGSFSGAPDLSEGQEQGGWGCKSSRTSSRNEIYYILDLFTVLRWKSPPI